ncbi:ubiquitin-specific protease otu1 [Lignoscripta atroalba]|nr:ubiquitin-specific protease otu1 [Lignoscripta atroalba]
MRVRVRGPTGQSVITLPDTATVGDLESQVSEKTSIAKFDVMYGYPPKPLQLELWAKSTKLGDVGVKLDGEQLIVSEKVGSFGPGTLDDKNTEPKLAKASQDDTVPSTNGSSNTSRSATPASFSFAGVGAPPSIPTGSKPNTQAKSTSNPPLSLTRKAALNDPPELPLPTHASTLLLRIMPDDNSCLFRAFGSAFFGAMDNMTELRSLIAQNIQAQPDIYPQVVLEQPPDDYARWIQSEDAWGGAIELDILSKHFDIEICSIDVQTLRIDRFNEGRPSRCILVYSGIHYDVIALSPSDPPYNRAYAPPEFDTKIFDASDQIVLERAVELCKILQGQHYFTDTAAFDVRCNVCGTACKGEKGATEHARQTGHYDFGEGG